MGFSRTVFKMSENKSGTPTVIGTVESDINDIEVVDYGTGDGFPAGVPNKI